MNHLSSPWTVAYFCLFLLMVILEIVVAIVSPWPPGTIANGIVLLLLFFYFRKVKIIEYDSDWLYVRGPLQKEVRISMGEIHSLNVPDSWGDRIYQLELKSGRIIEFVASFQPTTFIWQKAPIPENVRQFQRVLNTFETRQRSAQDF